MLKHYCYSFVFCFFFLPILVVGVVFMLLVITFFILLRGVSLAWMSKLFKDWLIRES